MAEAKNKKIQLDKIDKAFDDTINKFVSKIILKNKLVASIQKVFGKYWQVIFQKSKPISSFVQDNIGHVFIASTAVIIYLWYMAASDLEKVDFAFEMLKFSILAYFIFWFIPKLFNSVWFRRFLFLFLFLHFLNSCGIEKQPHTLSLSKRDQIRLENLNHGHSSLGATAEEKKIPPLLNAKSDNGSL